jgi:phosphatidylglycerophosphatase A
VNAPSPSLKFLFAHPAHFVALGAGTGLAPAAPGTFGTLLAIPLALALHRYASAGGFLLVALALFAIGAWAAHVTGRHLRVPDHGSIVVDEVAAFLLVLFFAGSDPWQIALAFALFRFFDIVKPPPIRQFDAAWKNGFGVMFDDLLAAGYALLALALLRRVF